MSQLVVYKASAGSGKTFTLAVEYIKLLLKDPRAYRHILAVTFTNKATAEMKERILSQLYGLHTADSTSTPYLNKLMADTGLPEEEIRRSAGVALNCLLHDYSRFRVETIDSFFQSVLRNLARELGLAPHLNIELNTTEVLSEAVDQLMEKLTPSSEVLSWMLDYINERISEDKRWNVADEVKSFGQRIFDEAYQESGNGLRQALKQPKAVEQYAKLLRICEQEALQEMAYFAQEFEEMLAAHRLSPEELKRGKTGISSYFNKLKEGKIGNDVRNQTVENCLDSAAEWGTKSKPRFTEIETLAVQKLIPLLTKAEEKRFLNNSLVNSCRLSLQHLDKLRLLTHIDEEVRACNQENNRFLLADTNALLHGLMRQGDSSFVFEKIGTHIRHVMIDEFQDTSRMQWSNFRLLLLEGLSQGEDSLIVGDVKQSIYRWRNGDWGILNNLRNQIDGFPIRLETLNTNRRSETRIIQFNNRVFTAATRYLNTLYRAQTQQDCIDLQQAYSDVEQLSPRTDEQGYVKLSFIDNAFSEEDYRQQTLMLLGNELQRLTEQGISFKDMAILVRKNKYIPLIADYLEQTLHFPVVSDEAFRLDASTAVCILVDAIRHLSHPENRITTARLAVSYCTEVLQEHHELTALLSSPNDYLPHAFTEQAPRLRMMPLYELFETLFGLFELRKLEKQEAYLFAFFDAVIEYLQNHPSDPDAFIQHWEDRLAGKTISGGEPDGIRIFSIHKSKGLEFHTVLIPFCDWTLESEHTNQLVWCFPPTPPFNQLEMLPITYSKAMEQSIYAPDFLREQLQLWVDSLNLLYVAFTRAGKNLLAWTRTGKKGTIAELLTAILPDLSLTEHNEETEWFFDQGAPCPSCIVSKDSTSNFLLKKPQSVAIKMDSLHHRVQFKQSNRSADFIQGRSSDESPFRFIDRGEMLHFLFSQIKTAKDADSAIEQLYFEGIIDSRQKEELHSTIHQVFKHPLVADWYSGQWEVFNECAILFQVDGLTHTKRPDRVMTNGEQTVVVDFKFGSPRAGHLKQVKRYMDLLQSMNYPSVSGYLWYVDQQQITSVSLP